MIYIIRASSQEGQATDRCAAQLPSHLMNTAHTHTDTETYVYRHTYTNTFSQHPCGPVRPIDPLLKKKILTTLSSQAF